jgi:ribonuclease P protein subunit RPR2
MAKAKTAKKDGKNTQSHIRARLDYLHQAAAYLQEKSTEQKSHKRAQANHEAHEAHEALNDRSAHVQVGSNGTRQAPETKQRALPVSQMKAEEPLGNLSRMCISHLRDVAMKTQIRLPVTLKRTLCKRCATLLTPGVTCSHEIRNESRGGKKPWADVLVIRCMSCGTQKRFPQTEKGAKKLVQRRQEKQAAFSQNGPNVNTSPAVLKVEEGVDDQDDSSTPPASGA